MGCDLQYCDVTIVMTVTTVLPDRGISTYSPLSYLSSQDQSFYDELGACCCFSGVNVDLIVACREHVHLAEQQILPKHTGGSVYLCNDLGTPYHNAALSQLHAYIQSLILEEHYWDCVMKLRVSGEIGIESVCGSVSTNEDEDPIAAMMNSHSTVEFCLDYPKYVEGDAVFLQAAILYPVCGVHALLHRHLHLRPR